MGANCNCVREQGAQPTINLANPDIENDQLGPEKGERDDVGDRCESEVQDEGEENIDIDLNDPEVQKAGLKIQV